MLPALRGARIDGRVLNAAYHLVLEMQYAKALAGLTDGLLVTGDAEYDEQRDVASILETNLSNQIGYYYVTRLKLHVHGGDWVGRPGLEREGATDVTLRSVARRRNSNWCSIEGWRRWHLLSFGAAREAPSADR